jgi:hypothetical protein
MSSRGWKMVGTIVYDNALPKDNVVEVHIGKTRYHIQNNALMTGEGVLRRLRPTLYDVEGQPGTVYPVMFGSHRKIMGIQNLFLPKFGPMMLNYHGNLIPFIRAESPMDDSKIIRHVSQLGKDNLTAPKIQGIRFQQDRAYIFFEDDLDLILEDADPTKLYERIPILDGVSLVVGRYVHSDTFHINPHDPLEGSILDDPDNSREPTAEELVQALVDRQLGLSAEEMEDSGLDPGFNLQGIIEQELSRRSA